VATELSSGAITSILEAVPGIATVLRSPVADAIVNLSRAAAGLAPFNPKDAHELIRYAVRRGLIRSDEGDRVAAEIDGVAPPKAAPPRPVEKVVHHHVPVQRKAIAKPAHRPKVAAKAGPKKASRAKARAASRKKK
jgi:hypothetical protein